MVVDLSPEMNWADLTNFAKDQWEIAYNFTDGRFTNKDFAVATIEESLPKAFSVVLHDTQAKHRDFHPKRQEWLSKKTEGKTGWESYRGVGKGSGQGGKQSSYGKHQSNKGYMDQRASHTGSNNPGIKMNGTGATVISSGREASREREGEQRIRSTLLFFARATIRRLCRVASVAVASFIQYHL